MRRARCAPPATSSAPEAPTRTLWAPVPWADDGWAAAGAWGRNRNNLSLRAELQSKALADEDDRGRDQAQPPRRGARRRDRSGRVGPDRHRGARLRAPERQDRGLPGRRVRGKAAAEGEAGDSRLRRSEERR